MFTQIEPAAQRKGKTSSQWLSKKIILVATELLPHENQDLFLLRDISEGKTCYHTSFMTVMVSVSGLWVNGVLLVWYRLLTRSNFRVYVKRDFLSSGSIVS